ncbi:hypothetical protein POJ06DRAFT_248557 [Lipomyces tetrasporus]|uniref:Uncharacterized protein n=1 Tax=Lipomyces tetrasporus TaxID=54092 RepID=A0AAD7QV14_9ASCO|nr:uncharacterized protein POJ06DRAFT_248557 [Lipomyces tetrasporus]KAJ8102028.1 hypothetical protein POJ06DRAFT_248557 [Lipomyces tetrasporus]
MTTTSENPPEPNLINLFVEFLRHVPSPDTTNDNTPSGDRPEVSTSLSPSFLQQLNPLLRARLAFNIQSFSFNKSDIAIENFDNDRILETVRHQWAELLSWPNPSSAPVPELGPILARKLYESRDLLLGETQDQHSANDDNGKVEIRGFARPDVETFLASAWLPETGVEIVWNWDNAERAWRVNEVKLALVDSNAGGFGDLDYLREFRARTWAMDMSEVITGVHGLTVNEQGEEIRDDDDDSYWGEYDKKLEGESEDKELVPKQESHTGEVKDDDYYNRYDNVTTALSSDLPQKAAGRSPVHIHILRTVRSLRELAHDSGISQDEFTDLMSMGLQE